MKRFSGRFLATIAALAMVAMVAQVAMAQREQGQRGRGGREGGPGGPGGGGGFLTMARLATIDKVQSALKLSDEQKSKIEKLNTEAREEMSKMRDSGSFDPEKMQKMRESIAGNLNKVLDEGQQKRLMGIFIQVAGAGAVMDPSVAKELNITDEQRDKLREAMGGMGPPREGREGRQGREGRGDNQTSFAERRAKMDKQIMAVLTSEQQKQLESLKGEKVDIDMSALRGPGGGRPGRGERSRPNRGSDDEPAEKKAA